MSTNLRVGNISTKVAEEDLMLTFGKFGVVEAVEIARDSVTGRESGYAIVSMKHEADAIKAVSMLNFTQYEGRTIGVGRMHTR